MAPLPSFRGLAVRSAPLVAIAATSAVTALSSQSNIHSGWSREDAEAQKVRDQWSSVIGWISIACWVIVYTPQLKENYDRKSGDGLSIAFVVIWLAGDFLNLLGALRQELLSTMIILAFYYSLCDVALIFQYYYYRKHHDYYHPALPDQPAEPSEETPLVPGTKPPAEQHSQSVRAEVFRYLAAGGLVIATGVAAWAVEQSAGDTESGGQKPEGPGWRWDAQIYGWLSAALYLASRVPQIFKNRQTKCEGLSLALFLFAVAGNLTYVASILLKTTDREYLIESLSWLVGSLGTVFLDFIVLGQFVAYREDRKAIAAAAAAAGPVRA